jgi:hypothetical protein
MNYKNYPTPEVTTNTFFKVVDALRGVGEGAS